MTVETTTEVDGETKTESEDKTLNSMVPLWKRPKSKSPKRNWLPSTNSTSLTTWNP